MESDLVSCFRCDGAFLDSEMDSSGDRLACPGCAAALRERAQQAVEEAVGALRMVGTPHAYDPGARFAPTPEEFDSGMREAYTKNSVDAHNRHNATNYEEVLAKFGPLDWEHIIYHAVRERVAELLDDACLDLDFVDLDDDAEDGEVTS